MCEGHDALVVVIGEEGSESPIKGGTDPASSDSTSLGTDGIVSR